MSVGRFLQQGAAGNAGEAVYVDDVFSTYLYTGNGGSQTTTNGIDLAGEGGLVWVKNRTRSNSHALYDTERGPSTGTSSSTNKTLDTSITSAEGIGGNVAGITSFNSDGFTTASDQISPYNVVGPSTEQYVSWTFRKQPGFFDIVTYSGNSSTQTISHNLGTVPGMIIVKRYDGGLRDWAVYHRSLGNGNRLKLNATSAQTAFAGWNNTTPTDTEFYLGNDSDVNNSAGTYVAYLFAHDAQDFGTDSDESIIKCGSYTGTYPSTTEVNLGFEPQFLLVKNSSQTSSWFLLDVMRGITADQEIERLFANDSSAEGNDTRIGITSNGFKATAPELNGAGNEYIYVAIRRPHKPASEFAATDLFAINTRGTVPNQGAGYRSGFVTDFAIRAYLPGGSSAYPMASSRISGAEYITTSATNAAISQSSQQWDFMDGYYQPSSANTDTPSFMFRRAPGFFDVVTYAGTNTLRTVDHNLGVAPELVIIKIRNAADNWEVWTSYTPISNWYRLNENTSSFTPNYFNSTSPTSTQFTLKSTGVFAVNQNGYNYVAYLFATVAGISKVGSYSGTGSDVNVNCGFTSGARFVLVKRTDSTGDWYLWDSARGIVAGNDPYMFLNSTAAQVTSTDYIDPLSSGFTITSTAPAALNASGGTYIFLAIA
jgi:hypothetical protein